MKTLGAIFAGGAGRRFGSDKARALLGGRALLDHVADRLRPQCDTLVVVGRPWPGLLQVEDRPAPGQGPLGALAGALAHAQEAGFTQVLTSGCDLPDLPLNLRDMLDIGPAVIRGQPLLGLWPTACLTELLTHLSTTEDRSMRGWIVTSGARMVVCDQPLANINYVSDLETLETHRD